MTNPFFERPILNSPYENPQRHWELDHQGQPTQKIIEARRRAEFITPIPKPRKRKSGSTQQQIVFDEGKGLSTETQAYDPTSIINEVRQRLASWRTLPSPFDWQVTPETARLLQHWRSHKFNSIRPFFCDSSQMPVMQGEREVKGVVTWKSIGSKLALGCKADHVGECREDARIVD